MNSIRLSSPLSYLFLRRVSDSRRTALCSVTRYLPLGAIREPVAWLKEGLRPVRSRINIVCRCFNYTSSTRVAVGLAMIRWERSLGKDRTKANLSQSTIT